MPSAASAAWSSAVCKSEMYKRGRISETCGEEAEGADVVDVDVDVDVDVRADGEGEGAWGIG